MRKNIPAKYALLATPFCFIDSLGMDTEPLLRAILRRVREPVASRLATLIDHTLRN